MLNKVLSQRKQHGGPGEQTTSRLRVYFSEDKIVHSIMEGAQYNQQEGGWSPHSSTQY